MKKSSRSSATKGKSNPILLPVGAAQRDATEAEARTKLIQELADLLRKNNLAELEFERDGVRVRLRQELGGRHTASVAHDVPAVAPVAPGASAAPAAAETNGLVTITSPIVGTFYRSPSPDADPYVEEGDSVRKGQVLCIVEAMKLMNEIESEVDGRVVKILVESAKPVEYGQPLFLIEPSSAA
ncbi:acetyl-CoA carboxylase, biotin carboxyl carrier protein [Nitrospira sp.]|nr:acetyl-CoA carboxylase, biotin carboxyl carrier protein [Nitrospira sp.]